MPPNLEDKKQFSLIARVKSVAHAGRGLWIFLKSTHAVWIQLSVAFVAIVMGFCFNISTIEWALIIFAIGLVLVAEAFNTAIEIDIDLTSPEFHPYARDTKDVSAGAVLLAVIIAVIIGLLVFLPKILSNV